MTWPRSFGAWFCFAVHHAEVCDFSAVCTEKGRKSIKFIATGELHHKFRDYDPLIGRFKAVDPLTAKYPWYTPYQFAGNKPILYVDLEGLEPQKGELDYGRFIFLSSGEKSDSEDPYNRATTNIMNPSTDPKHPLIQSG